MNKKRQKAKLKKSKKAKSEEKQNEKEGIRNRYASMGVSNYYEKHGKEYKNPHEKRVHGALSNFMENTLPKLIPSVKGLENIKWNKLLDLCCGSGEVTLFYENYHKKGIKLNILGCDPFTFEAYEKRTSKKALKYNFNEIQNGKLNELIEKRGKFEVIICSYALHLCDISKLPLIIYNLSLISSFFMVITPHKKPNLKRKWGLNLICETVYERVRIRFYESLNFVET